MMPNRNGPQVSSAGVVSFMRAWPVPIGQLEAGQVAVAGAPFDQTSKWARGARFGPRAIREHSLHVLSERQSRFDEESIDLVTGNLTRNPDPTAIADVGDFAVDPADSETTAAAIRDGVSSILERRAFPVILGGDHFVSLPSCSAFAQATRTGSGGSIAYVQFGSDLGLEGEDATWGKNRAGAQARRLIEMGFVAPTNVALVGASGFVSTEESQWASRTGITVLSVREMRRVGVAEGTRRALQVVAQGCDAIYVSVGLDVLDGSEAAGVGTTVIGGLTPRELLSSAEVLVEDPRIGAIDLVEVAPNLEVGGRTARLAVYVTNTFIGPRISPSAPSELAKGSARDG